MLPVYVDDLVEATLLAALRGELGRAYAAWSGEDVTFKDYFDRLAALVGGGCRVLPPALMRVASHAVSAAARVRGVPPELGPNALTFVNRRGSVSTARIREELGWAPAVSIEEGLARIARERGLENGSNTRLGVTSASAGASP
jgi:nucleoside-diphosphate-sugar epimerase